MNSRRKKNIVTTHGLSSSKTYYGWANMKSRCLYKKDVSFKNYGGRGIKVY